MNRIVKERIIEVVHHGLTLLLDNPSTERLEYRVDSFEILCYRTEGGIQIDITSKKSSHGSPEPKEQPEISFQIEHP